MILASCSATPSAASQSMTTTCARSMLRMLESTLKDSTGLSSLETLALRRMPAVSMKTYFCPSRSMSVSIASRVVPGRESTSIRSSPSSRLSMLDLPALGRPTSAMRGGPRSASASGSGASGSAATSAASSSPIPRPCSALTG